MQKKQLLQQLPAWLRSHLGVVWRSQDLSDAYFPESKVKLSGSEEIKPITDALPSIQGQIILEGDSGLGKSMFLRHLVKTSPRIHSPGLKLTQ